MKVIKAPLLKAIYDNLAQAMCGCSILLSESDNLKDWQKATIEKIATEIKNAVDGLAEKGISDMNQKVIKQN